MWQWVVRPEGCTLANPNLTNCEDSRGLAFNPNKSTSWSTERLEIDGLFGLTTYYESFLNLTGNAYYGFDTLTLGLPGADLPSLDNQIIAGIATNNYWTGFLGLSPIPFNFSSQDDATSMRDLQPSFLSSLKNQSLIPSLSWGYTAGASYRKDPTIGSLVLGGYDESRFTPNNVTFAFAADFSRDLTVHLRSIRYDTLGSSPLLTESIPIFINTLVTHLWLPTEVCQRFEEIFNLTWNDAEQLYLLDEEAHRRLSSLNPTFTLTLGHEEADSDTVEIALPYGAFDLSGNPPFTDPPSRYFPLKRAERAEQYTLGRVFLQGAYIVTDYERQSFTVSQAMFPDASKTSNTTLVGIAPPGYKEPSGGLGVGIIAGIVVGSVLGVLFVAAALFYWQRLCKRSVGETDGPLNTRVDEKMASEDSPRTEIGPELDAQMSQRHELGDAGLKGNELDGVNTNVIELDPQNERKTELAGHGGTCERHELP